VREQVGELSVRRLLGEFQQNFSSRAVDALRIGKVFVHDPVKCVEQFFFRIHSNCHVAHSRIPRSMIDVDENLCGRSPSGGAWRYCVCDVSTVRLVLLALGAAVYARGKYGVLQNVFHNLASTNGVYGYVGRTRPTPA
jgi:hypothetical protein